MRDTRCASRSARTSAQKELIMQNKPDFPDAQMNISSVLTKDYENVPLHRHRQNKPNQTQFKPNQSQSNPIQTQFPQRKNETKFQNKFRWITRKAPDIKKDLNLSPGPNSGGIIWGTGDKTGDKTKPNLAVKGQMNGGFCRSPESP